MTQQLTTNQRLQPDTSGAESDRHLVALRLKGRSKHTHARTAPTPSGSCSRSASRCGRSQSPTTLVFELRSVI